MSIKLKKLPEKIEKPFSLRELFDAIEANGVKQMRNGYWDSKRSWGEEGTVIEIGAACAVGMGAANIGAHFEDFEKALDKFRNSQKKGLGKIIVGRNDSSEWSLKRIVRHYREYFAEALDIRVMVPISYEVIKEN